MFFVFVCCFFHYFVGAIGLSVLRFSSGAFHCRASSSFSSFFSQTSNSVQTVDYPFYWANMQFTSTKLLTSQPVRLTVSPTRVFFIYCSLLHTARRQSILHFLIYGQFNGRERGDKGDEEGRKKEFPVKHQTVLGDDKTVSAK